MHPFYLFVCLLKSSVTEVYNNNRKPRILLLAII
jgi:hypothetical protein